MLPQQEIHRLAVHNRKLYQQLKSRELEYIALIRDLHEENHRLRQLLQPTGPVAQSKANKIVLHRNHQKTPSFNSAANSQIQDQHPFNVQAPGYRPGEDERFSFSVRNNIQAVEIARHFEPVPPHLVANNVDIIKGRHQNQTKLQSKMQSTEQSQAARQHQQPSNQGKLRVIESVDNQRLWSQKTYQSIGRDESRISDRRLAQYSISDQVLDSSILRNPRTPNSRTPMNVQDRSPPSHNLGSPENQQQQLSVLFYSKSTENVDNKSGLREAPSTAKKNTNLLSINQQVQSSRNKKSSISNRIYL